MASTLILGRGEEKTGGRRKHAIIADCYEALIAAIYLDGGFEPVRAFLRRQFQELIDEASRTGAGFTEDYKSALQELLQQQGKGLPGYRLIAEIGPAHRRRFEVEVLVGGEPLAKAEGKSKKDAAQNAAKLALECKVNLNAEVRGNGAMGNRPIRICDHRPTPEHCSFLNNLSPAIQGTKENSSASDQLGLLSWAAS